jgi:hypothetical protein
MDPIILTMRPIVQSVLQSRALQTAYSAFTDSGSPGDHNSLCSLLTQRVISQLSSLTRVSRTPNVYEFVFRDNRGLAYHRIPFNLNQELYFDADAGLEYSQWLAQSQVSRQKAIPSFTVQSRLVQPPSPSTQTSSETMDATSDSSSGEPYLYINTSSTYPLTIIPETGEYLYFDGFTGSNTSWDNVIQFLMWTPTSITVNGTASSSQTVNYIYTVVFSGAPPSITAECDDDLSYTIVYSSTSELNGSIGVFSATIIVDTTDTTTITTSALSL